MAFWNRRNQGWRADCRHHRPWVRGGFSRKVSLEEWSRLCPALGLWRWSQDSRDPQDPAREHTQAALTEGDGAAILTSLALSADPDSDSLWPSPCSDIPHSHPALFCDTWAGPTPPSASWQFLGWPDPSLSFLGVPGLARPLPQLLGAEHACSPLRSVRSSSS